MIATELSFTADLTSGVHQQPVHMAFLVGDEQAHRFVIRIRRNSEENSTDLSTASVYGYFKRADGDTVVMAGQIQENQAIVTLPAQCYAVPGLFSFVIKLDMDGVVSSIFWCAGTVTQAYSDVFVDPGNALPTLHELLAKIAELEKTIEEYEVDPERIQAIENSIAKLEQNTASIPAMEQHINTLQSDMEDIRNAVVITTVDPGAGAAVDYPDGTVIHVYE